MLVNSVQQVSRVLLVGIVGWSLVVSIVLVECCWLVSRVLLVGHLEVTSAIVPLQTLPPTLPAHHENRGNNGDDDNHN